MAIYNQGSVMNMLGVHNAQSDVYILIMTKPQTLKKAKIDSEAVMSGPNDNAIISNANKTMYTLAG